MDFITREELIEQIKKLTLVSFYNHEDSISHIEFYKYDRFYDHESNDKYYCTTDEDGAMIFKNCDDKLHKCKKYILSIEEMIEKIKDFNLADLAGCIKVTYTASGYKSVYDDTDGWWY